MNSDRTIHAMYDGMQIVRYDRRGKWYLEPLHPDLKRQRVTVEDAAKSAIWGRENANGRIFLGRLGGGRFDYFVNSYGSSV